MVDEVTVSNLLAGEEHADTLKKYSKFVANSFIQVWPCECERLDYG